jgi:hypothetical protein
MDALHLARLDKTAFSVASLTAESDEKQFWLSKIPYERLRAGTDAANHLWLQSVYRATSTVFFEVVEREPS